MGASEIMSLASVVVALVAVCVSAWGTHKASKAPLTSTYFSTMTAFYADYLECVDKFVYAPTCENRDRLSVSLHKLLLFAGQPVCGPAQELYLAVLDWAEGPKRGALELDKQVNSLGDLMRAELYQFQKAGKRTALEQKGIPTR